MRRLQELRDPLARDAAVAGGKGEPRGGEDVARRGAVCTTHGPITGGVGGGRTHFDVPGARHDLDARDIAPRLAAVAAGVHRQRAADGAGNACEEFGLGKTVCRGEPRHLGARDARFGANRPIAHLERIERRVQHQDRAAHAAVANEQVAAEAENRQRLVGGQLTHERGEIVAVGRNVDAIPRPAAAPARVAVERDVARKRAAQTR